MWYILNNNSIVKLIRCSHSVTLRREVKGKQVRILYDLVTVFGECAAEMPLTFGLGRRRRTQIREPGNLPDCWYGETLPRLRGIGCTVMCGLLLFLW